MDNSERPDGALDLDTPATVDAEQQEHDQTLILTAKQAAQQLQVDDRTVRRWIKEGFRTPGGITIYLEARQVAAGRNPEWRIDQQDLDAFQRQRSQTATEGPSAGQLARQAEESQALTLSVQFFVTELTAARAANLRLAREAGLYMGRNEALERELEALRARVTELELERERWLLQQQQKSWEPPKRTPRRIRLLPWQ